MSISSNDEICTICTRPGPLIFCSGGCGRSFHRECLNLSSNPSGPWTCKDCMVRAHTCFNCKKKSSDQGLLRCTFPNCNRFYHWSQACCGSDPNSIRRETFVCPSHHCSNCGKPEDIRDPLLKCFRCTNSFHRNCLPNNVKRLNDKYVLCVSHIRENPQMQPTNSNINRPHNMNSPYNQPMNNPYNQPMNNPYNQPMNNPAYSRGSPYPRPPLPNPSNYPPRGMNPNIPQQSRSPNGMNYMPSPSGMNYMQQPNARPFIPQQNGAVPPPPAPPAPPSSVKRPSSMYSQGGMPKKVLNMEQQKNQGLLRRWRDLRKAGIELTPKHVAIRERILNDIKSWAENQARVTQNQRDKLKDSL